MIKVYVKKQTNYPVRASIIKEKLTEFLKKKGIVSDSVVSVVLIGKKKMTNISKKYLGKEESHNVLSFTESETNILSKKKHTDFVYPPDEMLNLGEILICYPEVFEEAKKEGKLIEDKVYELVEHG